MPGDRPPVHRGNGLPIEKHVAGLRFQGTVQAPQEGTLAGTVRTEQAGNDPRVKRQARVLEHVVGSVIRESDVFGPQSHVQAP
jgi:hypothetical protein